MRNFMQNLIYDFIQRELIVISDYIGLKFFTEKRKGFLAEVTVQLLRSQLHSYRNRLIVYDTEIIYYLRIFLQQFGER